MISAIFQRVIDTTVMASILALIIIFIKYTFRDRLGARWNYAIWLLLIIRLIMPYGINSSLSVYNLAPSAVTDVENSLKLNNDLRLNIINTEGYKSNSISADGQNYGQIENNNIQPKFKSTLSDSGLVLAVIWAIGALFLIFLVTLKSIIFYFREMHDIPVKNEKTLELLMKCSQKLGIRKDISVMISNHVKSPCLFGIFRPRILLPKGDVYKIIEEDLEYVFLHELSHFKRKDILINWLAVVLQFIHWFNPIIWFSFKKMGEDCEAACDAYTLAHLDEEAEYKRYGLSIINLLSLPKARIIHPTAGFLGNRNKNQIVRRIKLINLFNKKVNPMRKVVPIVIIACLAVIGLTNPIAFAEDSNNSVNLANIALHYVEFNQTYFVFSPDLVNSDNVSDSQIQQMIDTKLSELNKFVKKNSDLYNRLSVTIQGALSSQKEKSTRTFAGYITDFKVNFIKINNDKAQLKVTYTAHATFGQWQTDKWVKVSPSNVINDQIELQKGDSGQWFITSDDWEFAPGSEP